MQFLEGRELKKIPLPCTRGWRAMAQEYKISSGRRGAKLDEID